MSMQHPFPQLEPEILHLLSVAKVTRWGPVKAGVNEIMKCINSYIDTEGQTGIPAAWIGPTDCREDDCNPHCAIGQGDPWYQVSRHVPAGYGPWSNKADADKFYLHYDHIDRLPPGQTWTLSWGVYDWEKWNGFGPRAHGRISGYPWSCTDVYDPPRYGGYGHGGKYVADGKWNPDAIDTQPGTVALYLELIQRRPELARAMGAVPVSPVPAPTPSPITHPVAPPVGVHNAEALQAALNLLGADPQLDEDGSIGRMTIRAVRDFQTKHGLEVDGLAGPKTWAAIDALLKQ